MSLKAFHIVFIALSIVLSIGCAVWAFVNWQPVFGGACAVVAVALIIYGINFLKKAKRIIT